MRTNPYYPQSNGKLERWHQTMKQAIRQKVPLNLEDARRIIGEYVREYNEVPLHSGIGYITPLTKKLGKEQQVWQERDKKLAQARKKRAQKRQVEREQEKTKTRLTEKTSLSYSR